MNNRFDSKTIKYRCVKAYLDVQLEDAELIANKGLGKKITNNDEIIKENLQKIRKIFKDTKSTYRDIEKIATIYPFCSQYYNNISLSIKKFFDIGDSYIPAFLALEVLRLYKEKGHNDFIEFDFLELQTEFEKFNKEDKNHKKLISKHYRCALFLMESMDRLKNKKRGKK